MNYWQIAAGNKDRNYIDLCLRLGVILNGPGSLGKWPECQEKLLRTRTAKKVSDIRRFAEEIQPGDIVVLREGTNAVHGVGIIIGDYKWNPLFGDVDGWNLHHTRRVNWLWKKAQAPKKFDTYTLKQGDTTQKLGSKVVETWIESLDLNFNLSAPLPDLPETDNTTITFEEISDFLFDKGVSSSSIETLNGEIKELSRIARWYQDFDDPSEFETVAYLAVPLLRALGWTPQKMAIEWNKIDIALFEQLPRTDKNLCVVVEAKKKGNSCLTAVSQAESYAEEKHSCKRLIVTDGLRYGIYIKENGRFRLFAYLNILNMKPSYPIYNCYGAKEAFIAMTPEWSNLGKDFKE